MDQRSEEHFFDGLPAFEEFSGVTDPANYVALPEDWFLATADIVSSTRAIEAGRYKAVNMAGASVISAVLNALGHRDLPFVFGGDGASIAVPPSAAEKTRAALAAVQTWVKSELDLILRAALVPVRDILNAGHTVRVARFRAASEVAYAMFTGGGTSWAEAEMKAGRYAVEPAPPGTRPDLTGLSCRWNPIAARNDYIVSIIALPAAGAHPRDFAKLVADVIALLGEQDREGHPLPATGPSFAWTTQGLDYEMRAAGRTGLNGILHKLAIRFQMIAAKIIDRAGLTAGDFDPRLYRADVARNSDFRKFDDGLKLTVDIDSAKFARLESLLDQARRAGLCHYGLHRQKDALMTCLVPSPYARDHLHFIDGAAGGYAMAAVGLKTGRAAA